MSAFDLPALSTDKGAAVTKPFLLSQTTRIAPAVTVPFSLVLVLSYLLFGLLNFAYVIPLYYSHASGAEDSNLTVLKVTMSYTLGIVFFSLMGATVGQNLARLLVNTRNINIPSLISDRLVGWINVLFVLFLALNFYFSFWYACRLSMSDRKRKEMLSSSSISLFIVFFLAGLFTHHDIESSALIFYNKNSQDLFRLLLFVLSLAIMIDVNSQTVPALVGIFVFYLIFVFSENIMEKYRINEKETSFSLFQSKLYFFLDRRRDKIFFGIILAILVRYILLD